MPVHPWALRITRMIPVPGGMFGSGRTLNPRYLNMVSSEQEADSPVIDSNSPS